MTDVNIYEITDKIEEITDKIDESVDELCNALNNSFIPNERYQHTDINQHVYTIFK